MHLVSKQAKDKNDSKMILFFTFEEYTERRGKCIFL